VKTFGQKFLVIDLPAQQEIVSFIKIVVFLKRGRLSKNQM
jgi:hypothetical protein